MKRFCVLLVGLFAFVSMVEAQFLSVDGIHNRYYRDLQLLSRQSLDNSWMLRPVRVEDDLFSATSLKYKGWGIFEEFEFDIHQAQWTSLYNSEYGYGRNLGSIFPSNGMTSRFSLQLTGRFRNFRYQLDPELIFVQNKSFQVYPASYPDWLWGLLYPEYLNLIDAPEMYRDASFMQILPGNSSIGYERWNMELALSTRSMWWGPGKRNSLLMSNNAPGFAHVSLNTVRPIPVVWGKIEFQLFWGRLVESGKDPVPYRMYENLQPMPYIPKPDDWRLIQGLTAIWQPKWSPGLYLGLGRTLVTYSKEIKRFDHAFSVFRSLKYYQGYIRDKNLDDLRDQFDDKLTAFVRYAMPEDNMEFYAEYARNLRPGSLLDFFRNPEHTMAYTIGLTKLYDFGADQYIGVDLELTHLEKENTWRERYYPTWYTSRIVPHGYTNRGQIMGASIGPGSNSQYLGVNYLWCKNRVGVFGERVIYNNDLYYILFTTSIYRLWADLNFGVSGEYHWRRFGLKYDLTLMNTFNYKYIELTTRPGFEYIGNDVFNVNLSTSLQYRF